MSLYENGKSERVTATRNRGGRSLTVPLRWYGPFENTNSVNLLSLPTYAKFATEQDYI